MKLEREGAPGDSEDEENEFLDLKEAKQIIGKVTDLNLVEVEDTSFHCLDGRVRNPSLFSPGGDFGEFLTALLSYEEMKAIELTQTQVDRYLVCKE